MQDHFDYGTLPARGQFNRNDPKTGSIESSTIRRNNKDSDYEDYVAAEEVIKEILLYFSILFFLLFFYLFCLFIKIL